MADDDATGNVSVQVDEPPTEQVEAPYGWTNDPKTGERRPKLRAGRGGGSAKKAAPPSPTKSLDELKAGGPIARGREDRAPSGKGAPASAAGEDKEPAPLPPFRAGPIAKGMNKLYLRAGKIVRAMDKDIGIAIIKATQKEADDDVTVGEAWEEIAKLNPRIRRVLLKIVEGGAWSQLFWAHAPIFMAVLMKERIARHIPFYKIIEALGSIDDEDEEQDGSAPGGGGSLPFGLRPEDVQQMMPMFGPMLTGMGANVPRSPGGPPRAPVPTANGAGDGEGPAP